MFLHASPRAHAGGLLCAIALATAAYAADLKEPLVPSLTEQERFLAAARQVALDYAKSLPDFTCTQKIRRIVEDIRPFSLDRYKLLRRDELEVELGYYQQQESYWTVGPTGQREPFLATGLTSRGELGSNLRKIFDSAAGTVFQFKEWTALRGRQAAVYSYRVERDKAQYVLTAQQRGRLLSEAVGLRGEAVIDRESHSVLRLRYMADGIPNDFPVRMTDVTVDYDFAEVAGRRYILPAKAQVELRDRNFRSFNEVEFQAYRKFSSESSIRFTDDPTKP